VLAELLHVCRHGPATLALKRRLPQEDCYAILIDRADRAGLAARRGALVADLRGEIVEVGCGTGAMFPHYQEGARVTAIEPDPAFAARARAGAPPAIAVHQATGEALPLAERSMDAAVLALVLCSVPDVDAVCREVARVVRPGGALRLIEHVRSERRVAGALMRAIDPLWLAINGQGCHLARDPVPSLVRAGFELASIEAFQIWSAGLPAFPMRAIRATRRG